MRRCMSDRVGRDGRVTPSKELDIMISPLARFRVDVGSRWPVEVVVEGGITQASMRLPDPGAALYKRWSGVSIRLLKEAFSFLSARLHVPGKWGSEDLPAGALD
jgi:hypothetical protein